MEQFLTVLAIAAIPAIANPLGGLASEVVRVRPRVIKLLLHVAAGIVFAMLSVEIVPRVMKGDPPWVPLLAFLVGGFAYVALERGIRTVVGSRAGAVWGLWLVVALDSVVDGLLMASGSSVSLSLAILIAIAMAPVDWLEAFPTMAKFREAGVTTTTRVVAALGLGAATLVAVTIGYWVLRGAADAVQLTAVAFAGGMLFVGVSEDLLPEGHTENESYLGGVLLAVGFVGYAMLTLVVG